MLEFTSQYGIPESLHPELPGLEDTIVEFPEGKVDVYTKFFEFANFHILISQFLFNILGHYQIHLSQLSVKGAAKVSHFEINCRVLNIVPTLNLFCVFYVPSFNSGWMSFSKRPGMNTPQCYTKPLDSIKNWNRFFLVDERVFPIVVDWRTNAPKDGMPPADSYSMLYDVKVVVRDKKGWAGLHDIDAVRVCLLIIAELVFMGKEDRNCIPMHLVILVEDLDAWNDYPWGEYMWQNFYERTVNIVADHRQHHLDEKKKNPNYNATYNLYGFAWAFKDSIPIVNLDPTPAEKIQAWFAHSVHEVHEYAVVLTIPSFRMVPIDNSARDYGAVVWWGGAGGWG
ncbi:hypothetical protein Tco_1015038 [Tanacetum coccineum]|uniref:Phospholipase-like protein n=1 Tax=Tanacetum coccineum TaxID=301880 RepID=A0ABQ5FKZ8_9ASTR